MVSTERTKIRMLSSVSGLAMPGYGIQGEFAHHAGTQVDIHPELAKAWIGCGYAELAAAQATRAAGEKK